MPSIKTADRTFVLCPELLLYIWNLLFVDEKEGFCSVGVSACSGSLVGAGRGGGGFLQPASTVGLSLFMRSRGRDRVQESRLLSLRTLGSSAAAA